MKYKSSGFSLIELSIVILIIGILIAGVTQGSRLVKQSKVKTAKTLTQSSDAIGINDMVLWLDATNEKIY
jgi:prepilin-type N-terminal cleavage/methylation domain-containing protein